MLQTFHLNFQKLGLNHLWIIFLNIISKRSLSFPYIILFIILSTYHWMGPFTYLFCMSPFIISLSISAFFCHFLSQFSLLSPYCCHISFLSLPFLRSYFCIFLSFSKTWSFITSRVISAQWIIMIFGIRRLHLMYSGK